MKNDVYNLYQFSRLQHIWTSCHNIFDDFGKNLCKTYDLSRCMWYWDFEDRVIGASIMNTYDKMLWYMLGVIKHKDLSLVYFEPHNIPISTPDKFVTEYLSFCQSNCNVGHYNISETEASDNFILAGHISMSLYETLSGKYWCYSNPYFFQFYDQEISEVLCTSFIEYQFCDDDYDDNCHMYVIRKYQDNFYMAVNDFIGNFFSKDTSAALKDALVKNLDTLIPEIMNTDTRSVPDEKKVIFVFDPYDITYRIMNVCDRILKGEVSFDTSAIQLMAFRDTYENLTDYPDDFILDLLHVNTDLVCYVLKDCTPAISTPTLVISKALGYFYELPKERVAELSISVKAKEHILNFLEILSTIPLHKLTFFNCDSSAETVSPRIIDGFFVHGTLCAAGHDQDDYSGIPNYCDIRNINLCSLTILEMADRLYDIVAAQAVV